MTNVAPVCVVFNPEAGTAEGIETLRRDLDNGSGIEFCPTEGPGDAARIAGEAVAATRRVVVAAGGDGTVSQVVNGLMDARAPGGALPDLLVLPFGTGNDLVRTLELPDTPEECLKLLQTGRRRALDVLRWRLHPTDGGPERSGWCINVVAGGFSAKLKESLTPEIKKFWGPLAYARAAMGSVDELEHPHKLTFRIDDGEARTFEAINVIVANARYAGGGMEVAPAADPSDGRLEFVVITPGDWLDLAGVTAKLLLGEVDQSQHTINISATSVELKAEPAMPFNIDGDPVGEGSLRVEVAPAALNVLVPGETSEA